MRLGVANCLESAIGYALDVTIAQSIGRHAEGSGFIRINHVLDDVGKGAPGLNQGTAQGFEKHIVFGMPRPVFGNLAGASRDHILVACPTALSVIDRSKAKSRCFGFFKDEAAIVEGARWNHIIRGDGIEVGSLGGKAVGQVIKTGLGRRTGGTVIHRRSDPLDVKPFGRAFGPSRTRRKESLGLGLTKRQFRLCWDGKNCRNESECAQ